MRVVLDTNILASAIRAERGPIALIRESWLSGLFCLHISQVILDELEHTLGNPYFSSRLGQEESHLYLTSLKATSAVHIIPSAVPRLASHEEDDFILATAKSASADFLITGDKHLQVLQCYEGTRILPPQPFSACLLELTDLENRLRFADREALEKERAIEDIVAEITTIKFRTIENYKNLQGFQ